MRALFILLVAICASSGLLAEDTNFFPVMGWNSVPNNLEAVRTMKECGLTVAGFASPNTLKLCREAGLKAIVSDSRISGYSDWSAVTDEMAKSNVTSLINKVGTDSTIFGYYLKDEPSASDFGGLAKVAKNIRELAPGKWPYINLLPNYADNNQTGTPNYPEYLQRFCKTCHPTILSYDHYALTEDGQLGAGYFKNLEQMRVVALSNSLPFWNIIQGMGFLPFREPDAADFRFQVYTSLAYGVRGIAYFQYEASSTLSFRASAIDHFGHRTPTYGYMQDVNFQIAKLAPTLLQLTSDDVYHFGALPDGCHKTGTNDLIKKLDGDFMVGDFTHRDGSRYALVVNKNFKRSAYVTITYNTKPKKVLFVSPYHGKESDFAGEHCCLAPGQGVLLKLVY